MRGRSGARSARSSLLQVLHLGRVRGVVHRDAARPHAFLGRMPASSSSRASGSPETTWRRAVDRRDRDPLPDAAGGRPRPAAATDTMPPRPASTSRSPDCAGPPPGRRPQATERPRPRPRRSRPGNGPPPRRLHAVANATARPATPSPPTAPAGRHRPAPARPASPSTPSKRPVHEGLKRRRALGHPGGEHRRGVRSSAAIPTHCEPWPGKTNTGRAAAPSATPGPGRAPRRRRRARPARRSSPSRSGAHDHRAVREHARVEPATARRSAGLRSRVAADVRASRPRLSRERLADLADSSHGSWPTVDGRTGLRRLLLGQGLGGLLDDRHARWCR